MSIWFVSVVPKYLNVVTFSNVSLAILIFWFCPEFGWRDIIICFPQSIQENYETEVQSTLCLTKHHSIKAYAGVEAWPHTFLTLATDGGEWSASRPDILPPGKEPRYPLDSRLGGLQVQSGRDGEEKSYWLPSPQPSNYTDWTTPAHNSTLK
jgi:hypothetical protein